MTQRQVQGQVHAGQWDFDQFCINKLFVDTALSNLSDGFGLVCGIFFATFALHHRTWQLCVAYFYFQPKTEMF